MDWFERLVGFREDGYTATRARLVVEGGRLKSLVNQRSWAIGELEMASLSDLRARAAALAPPRGPAKVGIVEGDVRQLHAAPEFAGALFQVASQFNALEMVHPDVRPEDGVTRYVHDDTQGPACALAAGAATLYRNYFASVAGGYGQTAQRQLDGLADVGSALAAALGRPVGDLWGMRNGYALPTRDGLSAVSGCLERLDETGIDDLRGRLAIAIQRGVEVTDAPTRPGPLVSQAFCSALPVAYADLPADLWRPFAVLVLEAAYEATLWEAVISATQGRSPIVLLTLLGGGAFGNATEWIFSALRRALRIVAPYALDVRLVSYGPPSRQLRQFAESL